MIVVIVFLIFAFFLLLLLFGALIFAIWAFSLPR